MTENSLHWTQAALIQQRSPVILQLNVKELDSLLKSYQLKHHLNQHFNNLHSTNLLTPYTQSSINIKYSPINQLIQSILTQHSSDYDAIGLPLTNSNWRLRWESLCIDDQPPPNSSNTPQLTPNPSLNSPQDPEHWRRNGHFFLNEVNLHHSLETNKTICFASDWLELDATAEGIRFDCELALKQELSYATYLNASHLIIPPIRTRRNISDYARALCSILNGLPSSVVISIITPIVNIEKCYETWEDWHVLRKLCGYHPRLNLTLEVSQFRGGIDVSSLISRWSSEPIGFILIPASTFISNAKQYPVLSKSCQTFVKSMLKYKPCIILSQTLDGKHSSGGSLAYVQYIRFLEKKLLASPTDPIENFASGYLDYLQVPLQPLADNLDSSVYEGFEKDPIKYSKYEEAIYQVLCDRVSDVPQILAVCGAGRGPLVEAAIRASRRANQLISLVAIEKNPNSYLTLQERLKTEWDPKIVQIWFGDMRDFKPDEPIDILISELLGSFGDNELSPECLDGVIRWLAADGVSIPCSYSSFLAPLSSTKIYSRAIQLGKFETPYVVMIHSAEIISGNHNNNSNNNSDIAITSDFEFDKIQEAWSFDHPRTDLVYSLETGVPITNFHNARSSHLTFHIAQPSICHGLAGYFRATLHGSIVIETLPDSRMSREMLSWFPIFFPFKEPIYCPKGSELDVHIWRLTDQVGKKVWYEWSAEGFLRIGGTITTTRKKEEDEEEKVGEKEITNLINPSLAPTLVTSTKKSTILENTDPALFMDQVSDSTNTIGIPITEEQSSLLINDNPLLVKDESMDQSGFTLDSIIPSSRIRFAVTSLHNVLGKESFVKW